MHLLTYLLAFQRLAPRVAMFWGHGITTGIPHDAVHAFISCKHFHTDSVLVDESITAVNHPAFKDTSSVHVEFKSIPVRSSGEIASSTDNAASTSLPDSSTTSVGEKLSHMRWVSAQDQARFVERLYLMDSLTTVIPRPPVSSETRQSARATLAMLISRSPFRRYGDVSADGSGSRVVFMRDDMGAKDGSLRLGSPQGPAVNVYLCPQVSRIVCSFVVQFGFV
jgi:hypothetical protein